MNNKMNAMDMREMHRSLDDFSRFCQSFDVRKVIAAAEEKGGTRGQEKEVYALAILRALHNGDFGSDNRVAQAAVSELWERGNQCGFNSDSFNAVFEEFFSHW
jgi:hypothetical protein